MQVIKKILNIQERGTEMWQFSDNHPLLNFRKLKLQLTSNKLTS